MVAEEAIPLHKVLLYEVMIQLVERMNVLVLDPRFFGQHARDVRVVDPQEWRVEVGLIQPRRQMSRYDEGAAGAVRRVGRLGPFLHGDAPLGATLPPQHWHPPPHGAQDLRRESFASEGRPAAVVTQIGHQTEDVDDHVVIGLQDPLRLQTVLVNPLQRRHPL